MHLPLYFFQCMPRQRATANYHRTTVNARGTAARPPSSAASSAAYGTGAPPHHAADRRSSAGVFRARERERERDRPLTGVAHMSY